MFDNPKKALQRLQEELLAEEEDLTEEEQWEEDETEEDLNLADIDALLSDEDDEEEDEQELFYRNHANGYGADVRNYANRYGRGNPKRFDFDPEEEDVNPEAEEVLYRADYRKATRKTRRKRFGLVILAALELAAIIAIIVWWISWM